MKKSILVFLAAVQVCSVSIPAFAANETAQTYDVTMSVGANVVRSTDEKVFGYNMEWGVSPVLSMDFLDKNYDKFDSFSNSFENEAYYAVAPEYKEAYWYTTSTEKNWYISNGNSYGGMLSATQYMVKNSGLSLYKNQYDESGVLQKPAVNVNSEATVDGAHEVMTGAIRENLVTGKQTDGWSGFNTELTFATDRNQNIDDLTVVSDASDSTNHVAKLAPESGNDSYSSYFGRNSAALVDRKTKMSYKIKIESDQADSRLGITKDWNIENIKDVSGKDLKYLANALQFVKVYTYTQERAWFDAVRFANGKIYLAGDEVGTYDKNKWYTVEYTLDTENSSAPKNGLVIKDGEGNPVLNIPEQAITLDSQKNMGRDLGELVGSTNNPLCNTDFAFNDRSRYGYFITAHSNSSVKTVAYIDDIDFATETYYDEQGAVINSKLAKFRDNYNFPYGRMAGGSANTFHWKKAIGDAKTRERGKRYESDPYGITRATWGLPEWMKFVNYMNPKAESSYVININDSNQDIIDLIEYLTADGDIDNNGIDWSAQRKADGVEKPARISFWEISNEPDLMSRVNVNWEVVGKDSEAEAAENAKAEANSNYVPRLTVGEFLNRAGEIVEILKQYAPDIPIAIPTDTSTYSSTVLAVEPERIWTDEIVAQDWIVDCDYISYHSYQTNYNITGTVAPYQINKIIQSDASKNKNLKIAYTEHGTSQPYKREYYYRGIGLSSALDESAYFNRIFNDPNVVYANQHSYNLYPGPWGIGYEKDGEFYAGASYKLMDMYYKNGVGQVLGSTIDGYAKTYDDIATESGWDHKNQTWKDGKYGYTCSAVLGRDGSLNLFISNQRNHTLNLNLNLNEKFERYEVTKQETITGNAEDDTMYSFDGPSNIAVEWDENGNVTKYELQERYEMVYDTKTDVTRDNITISPYSVTLIKLESDNTVTPVVASYKGQQRLDFSGVVGSAHKETTLLVTDKSTGLPVYTHQITAELNGNYRYNFEFPEDIDNYEFRINLGGELKILDSSDFIRISDPAALFKFTTEVSGTGINITINNLYNMLNVNHAVLAAEFGADDRLADMKILTNNSNTVLGNGANSFSMTGSSGKSYKILFWESLDNARPLATEKCVSIE